MIKLKRRYNIGYKASLREVYDSMCKIRNVYSSNTEDIQTILNLLFCNKPENTWAFFYRYWVVK